MDPGETLGHQGCTREDRECDPSVVSTKPNHLMSMRCSSGVLTKSSPTTFRALINSRLCYPTPRESPASEGLQQHLDTTHSDLSQCHQPHIPTTRVDYAHPEDQNNINYIFVYKLLKQKNWSWTLLASGSFTCKSSAVALLPGLFDFCHFLMDFQLVTHYFTDWYGCMRH